MYFAAMTLAAVVELLRKRLEEYRHANRMHTRIQAPVNILEIALNIAELAIDKNRPLSDEDVQWFRESWQVIHCFENTEWEDLTDLYRTLTHKMEERNWFRSV